MDETSSETQTSKIRLQAKTGGALLGAIQEQQKNRAENTRFSWWPQNETGATAKENWSSCSWRSRTENQWTAKYLALSDALSSQRTARALTRQRARSRHETKEQQSRRQRNRRPKNQNGKPICAETDASRNRRENNLRGERKITPRMETDLRSEPRKSSVVQWKMNRTKQAVKTSFFYSNRQPLSSFDWK
jgi:hypothetical protein